MWPWFNTSTGFYPIYTHTKSYGPDIIPPEEIRGRKLVTSSVSLLLLTVIHLGEYIEGLKHFAVSDVKFHPQR